MKIYQGKGLIIERSMGQAIQRAWIVRAKDGLVLGFGIGQTHLQALAEAARQALADHKELPAKYWRGQRGLRALRRQGA